MEDWHDVPRVTFMFEYSAFESKSSEISNIIYPFINTKAASVLGTALNLIGGHEWWIFLRYLRQFTPPLINI